VIWNALAFLLYTLAGMIIVSLAFFIGFLIITFKEDDK
jgi:hypothetical protein